MSATISVPPPVVRPVEPAPAPLPLEYERPLDRLPASDLAGRALWLDAFRGFVMFCLISRSFGFYELKSFRWAAPIAKVLDHADWVGITPWDMIQPYFMFIVGVAMPYAFAKRRAMGDSWGKQFLHALKRAGLLLLWANIAMSASTGHPIIELINVLNQIAFAYLIAFFVLGRRWPIQLAVAVALLAGHTALHLYWHPFGVAGPWVKEGNVGWYLDRHVLNKNWEGGYATINFVTSAGNVIGGVMAGELLRSAASVNRKTILLVVAGLGLIGAGVWLATETRVPVIRVPVIKRIWTASFAMISTGISLLTLLGFYRVHLRWPKVRWGLFLAFGANPIFLYLGSIMFGGQVRKIIGTYTLWVARTVAHSSHTPLARAEPWANFATVWIALGVFTYIAFWLYRRKIFIRL